MTSQQALAFVEANGIVLESARGPAPTRSCPRPRPVQLCPIAQLSPSPLRGWEVPPPRPYTARIVARLKTIARLLLIAALCIVAGLAPRVHHRVVELTPRPQLRMRLGKSQTRLDQVDEG